jgi:hypothetical protein
MPISRDEFQRIDGGSSGLDLSLETPLGSVYRFLLTHASHAFRQSEVVDDIERPQEEIESALTRLNQRGFVERRGQFWAIADTEHAAASAGLHGIATAADRDGGFSEKEVSTWMDTAVDPVRESHHNVDEEIE